MAKHPDVPFIIDFHTHMLDEELREICTSRNAITAFGQKKAPPSANLRKFLDPDAQIADMDERGIDMHVVFTGPVHMSAWWADPQTEADAAHERHHRGFFCFTRDPDELRIAGERLPAPLMMFAPPMGSAHSHGRGATAPPSDTGSPPRPARPLRRWSRRCGSLIYAWLRTSWTRLSGRAVPTRR